MGWLAHRIKGTVATACILVTYSLPLSAQQADIETLLQDLREADPADAERIAKRISNVWSKSGSASMDLLLKRGRDSLETGEFGAAIEHLSALTDHAPDFAEGWAARALAFYQTGEYGLALADLGQALTLNPNHFGAMQGLGAVMEQLGESQLAFDAYKRVLAIHPHHPEVVTAVERLESEINGLDL